jgi:lysophospholipase L1-like esterase
MSALGDSLTRAFGAEYTFTPTVAPYVLQPAGRCDNTTTPPNIGYWDCPEVSWATGDDSSPSFNSHYKALVAAGSSITRADVHNNAYSGSKMAALAGQVAQAVAQNPDYVTIGMGGNDACGTFTGGAMTPVIDFRTKFEGAMATLTTGLPNARIFVASVPNMFRLWEVMHANTNPSPSPFFATIAAYSAYIWNGAGNPNPDFKLCQSMFANPASMAQEDVDRRAAALQRIRDYNDVLRDVCGQHAPRCKYDGGAGFDHTQTLTEANVPSLMSFDYFHPKPAFQSSIATATYAAGFNW